VRFEFPFPLFCAAGYSLPSLLLFFPGKVSGVMDRRHGLLSAVSQPCFSPLSSCSGIPLPFFRVFLILGGARSREFPIFPVSFWFSVSLPCFPGAKRPSILPFFRLRAVHYDSEIFVAPLGLDTVLPTEHCSKETERPSPEKKRLLSGLVRGPRRPW